MNASELKVGDKIRIIAVPDNPMPDDTLEVYKMLVARRRAVRIAEIRDGQPWYWCKKDGEWHSLVVAQTDTNWVPVKSQPERVRVRVYYGKRRGEKQKDILFDGLRSDARYLCQVVFTEEVLTQLSSRGYDLTTLKFEVKKKE